MINSCVGAMEALCLTVCMVCTPHDDMTTSVQQGASPPTINMTRQMSLAAEASVFTLNCSDCANMLTVKDWYQEVLYHVLRYNPS